MKSTSLLRILPLVLLLPACGSSNALNYLKGTYELATGCDVKLTSSSATGSCDTSSVKAEVKITISKSSIKIDTFTWTTKQTNTTCFDERTCTTTYTGSAATKGSGSSGSDAMAPMMAGDGGDTTPDGGATQADAGSGSTPSKKGMFSGLKGDWTGSVKAALACEKETAKTSAPTWCKATTAETITYTFDATGTDHEIKVDWYGNPKAGKGKFSIYETKTGVRAGSKFFKRTSGGSTTKKDGGSTTTSDATMSDASL